MNQFSQQPLLHIGLHKTATTFLQTQVFNREDFGYSLLSRKEAYTFVHQSLKQLTPFDPIPRDIAQAMHESLQNAEGRNLRMVLSHERLSGYPGSGGYDSKMIADWLSQIFPSALIVIIIREQKSLIESMYSQMITDGYGGSLKDFLNSIQPDLSRVPQFNLSMYKFDKLISYYQRTFGKESVLVLPYEMMKDDVLDFVNRIHSFSSIHNNIPLNHHDLTNKITNKKRGRISQFALRHVNRLFYKNQLSPSCLVDIPYAGELARRLGATFDTITPVWCENYFSSKDKKLIRDFIDGFYRESNTNASSLIGIDLLTYGYDSK